MKYCRDERDAWVLQYEGHHLEGLAKTVGDRIFLCIDTTWYTQRYDPQGKLSELKELIQDACRRAKMVGLFYARPFFANNVVYAWEFDHSISSDEDQEKEIADE
jgi:hypothetical protein